jgi:hypothetical protein
MRRIPGNPHEITGNKEKPVGNSYSHNVLLQSSTDLITCLTLLAGTVLLRLIIAHTLSYVNPILQLPAFFLDSCPFKIELTCCPEMSIRN